MSGQGQSSKDPNPPNPSPYHTTCRYVYLLHYCLELLLYFLDVFLRTHLNPEKESISISSSSGSSKKIEETNSTL